MAFSSKDFERALKKEVNAQLNALTTIKLNAVFDTLAKLALELTHGGATTRKGRRARISSNIRGGAIGSPVYTGQYALNHRIVINGAVPDAIIFSRRGERERVQSSVNLSPEELVAREKGRIGKRIKFTDTISIINVDPKAEEIEVKGTPLVPEGGFYQKAYEYLMARLERDLHGAASVSIRDASRFVES